MISWADSQRMGLVSHFHFPKVLECFLGITRTGVVRGREKYICSQHTLLQSFSLAASTVKETR